MGPPVRCELMCQSQSALRSPGNRRPDLADAIQPGNSGREIRSRLPCARISGLNDIFRDENKVAQLPSPAESFRLLMEPSEKSPIGTVRFTISTTPPVGGRIFADLRRTQPWMMPDRGPYAIVIPPISSQKKGCEAGQSHPVSRFRSSPGFTARLASALRSQKR